MFIKIFIIVLWSIVLFYWGVSTKRVNPDVRKIRLPLSRFFNFRNVSIVMLILELLPHGSHWIFQENNLSNTYITIGIILCVSGLTLAIWSKKSLGRNWSGSPSIRDNHSLITSGPYKMIRHPLYAGLILTFVGLAIIGMHLYTFILVLFIGKFVAKIIIEEKLMTEKFSQDYLDYKKQTKMIVPFVI